MGRPRVALALAVLLPLVLGEEPRAPTPTEAVDALVNAMVAKDAAVRVGMALAQADAATPGAARHLDDRYLPLAGSWLDKDRRFLGTVLWDLDLETSTKVDTIRVVLITGPFDKAAMVRTVVAAGKRHGFDLENDEVDPDTYYDTGLWITLGRDVVVLEISPL